MVKSSGIMKINGYGFIELKSDMFISFEELEEGYIPQENDEVKVCTEGKELKIKLIKRASKN